MSSITKMNTEGLTSELTSLPDSISTVVAEEKFLDKNVSKEIQLEELKTLQEYNRTLKQNNDERKKYAGWIFLLTCFWAFLIFIIIFMQGLGHMTLSDQVMITLITSTTINFFGFFLLVVKYLFNSRANLPVAKKEPPIV